MSLDHEFHTTEKIEDHQHIIQIKFKTDKIDPIKLIRKAKLTKIYII